MFIRGGDRRRNTTPANATVRTRDHGATPPPAFRLRARPDRTRTVGEVTCFVSKPVAGGHLVVVDLPDDASVNALMLDEDEPRDITEWFADLVLLGLAARQDKITAGQPEPAEEVQVATVTVGGTSPDAVRIIYVHHPSLAAASMDISDALAACALGIAHQITAGVAYEEAQTTDFDTEFSDLPTVGPDDAAGQLPPGA